MSAALVPRVRVIAVCDEALASEVEADVFTLENVRFDIVAESFPLERSLDIYLLLSHYRAGDFTGIVRLTQGGTDRMVRYERLAVSFDGEREYRAVVVPFDRCVFSAPGYYDFEACLVGPDGEEVKVADRQLILLAAERAS